MASSYKVRCEQLTEQNKELTEQNEFLILRVDRLQEEIDALKEEKKHLQAKVDEAATVTPDGEPFRGFNLDH
jgi:uncharacterized coiled-coil DUF342 family protein